MLIREAIGIQTSTVAMVSFAGIQAIITTAWVKLEWESPTGEEILPLVKSRLDDFSKLTADLRSDVDRLKDDAVQQVEARKEFLKRVNPGDPWQQG